MKSISLIRVYNSDRGSRMEFRVTETTSSGSVVQDHHGSQAEFSATPSGLVVKDQSFIFINILEFSLGFCSGNPVLL